MVQLQPRESFSLSFRCINTVVNQIALCDIPQPLTMTQKIPHRTPSFWWLMFLVLTLSVDVYPSAPSPEGGSLEVIPNHSSCPANSAALAMGVSHMCPCSVSTSWEPYQLLARACTSASWLLPWLQSPSDPFPIQPLEKHVENRNLATLSSDLSLHVSPISTKGKAPVHQVMWPLPSCSILPTLTLHFTL